MRLHAALADPRRYRRQIERLHARHLATRRLYELRQSEVSLASLFLNRATVARLLARTVARGEYRLAPAKIRTIVANGKERVVFAYHLTDLIVHGVVAGILEEAIAPRLAPSLYSYRKGVSWRTATSRLAAYVRRAWRAEPDVRRRGLYVLRRDIDSYTDSIPVGDASPVWEMVRAALGAAASGEPIVASDWRLVERAVRPEAFVRRGEIFTQYRGVATGQPISCVLFNLYLAALDAELERIPGAFYARYCDDLVFAHPDPEIVRAVDGQLVARLDALGLQLNARKSRTLYLTMAGRPSAAWPEAKGTTVVPFLGCQVFARGTVSLSREKRRRLLADLRRRALRTARALPASSRSAVGRTVCAVVNRALSPRLEPAQQRSAALLRRSVTDRHDLEQLDYCIARIVLHAVTGERSPRAFRAVPYRMMRRRWKLVSLLQARNKVGRGARAAGAGGAGAAADGTCR